MATESKEVAKKENPLKALEAQIATAKNVKDLLKINAISNRYIANYEAGTGRKDGAEKYEREAFAFIELANSKPDIMKCDPFSIFAGFIKAGLTGLSFNSNRLSVYPRGGKLVVEPDAHGKREMMERMPSIKKIDEGVIVYKNDVFSYDPKNKKVIKHEQEWPTPLASKDTVKAAYCVVHFADKHTEDIAMSLAELEIARSKSQQNDGGMLWKQHYAEACKKSTYNRAFKILYQAPDTAVIFKQYEPEDATDTTYSEVTTDAPDLSAMAKEQPEKRGDDEVFEAVEEVKEPVKETKKRREAPDLL